MSTMPNATSHDGDIKIDGSSSEDEPDEDNSNHSIPIITPAAQQDVPGVGIEELVVACGQSSSSSRANQGKQRKKELEPSMDFLTNAEKRPGVMCLRKVFDVCFDNTSAGGKVLITIMMFTK
ncbi:hypothetical protein BDN67DRAFT_1013029 [Paxillus ammoniavirescens]|nr:hypothetical protein BDN67DRAFT_1013029 [Paxillus ammoniavirescens]